MMKYVANPERVDLLLDLLQTGIATKTTRDRAYNEIIHSYEVLYKFWASVHTDANQITRRRQKGGNKHAR